MLNVPVHDKMQKYFMSQSYIAMDWIEHGLKMNLLCKFMLGKAK